MRNTQAPADWTDPRIQLTARSALGRLGVAYPSADYGTPTATMLRERGDLRRAIKSLSDAGHAAQDRGDTTALQQAVDETEAVSAVLGRVQSLLDAAHHDAGHNEAAGSDVWELDGRRVRAMRTAADFRAHYEQRAQPHERDGETSLADFFRGVARMGTTPAIKAALTEGTDSQGGYAVPSLVMPGILEALTATTSLLNAGAGIVPLTDGAKTYTLAAVSTAPTAAWRAEGGAVAESDPVFRGVTITPRSLAFYFKVSRELLADAPDMEQALRTAIAQSMGVALDAAGLRGSGTPPTPRGLLATSGIQSITNGAAGTALGTIKYANLNSAYQGILEANGPPPTVAIMSPRTLIGFSGLADSTGQPLRRPPLLDPLKFIATSAIPNNLTVGASTDCTELYCADFATTAFFMRETLSVQLATELFAGNGQIGFICHCRADFAARYAAAVAVCTGIRP